MHYHALCCWVAHCRCGRRSGCCCIVVLSVAPLALLCGESGKATRCSKYVFHFEHLPVIQQLCVMQSNPFSPTFQTSNEELTWPELSRSLRECFAVLIFLQRSDHIWTKIPCLQNTWRVWNRPAPGTALHQETGTEICSSHRITSFQLATANIYLIDVNSIQGRYTNR